MWATFVNEVVMLLTQREQVVDRCFAAVTEELDVMHLAVINDRPASERLVSDTKRSGAGKSSEDTSAANTLSKVLLAVGFLLFIASILVTVVRHRRSRQVAH